MRNGLKRRNGGFTLIELIIVLVLVVVLSTVAFVAIWSSLTTWTLSTASSEVITHIRYAQHLARTRNGWYGIRFQANPTNTYNVYYTDGVTDTNVSDPANPAQDLIINVDSLYDGVSISAVNIDGGDKVEFDPRGTPYTDMSGAALAANGTVTLSLSGSTNVIVITKTTGRTELQ